MSHSHFHSIYLFILSPSYAHRPLSSTYKKSPTGSMYGMQDSNIGIHGMEKPTSNVRKGLLFLSDD